MMVGHALFAFAIVAGGLAAAGANRERALTVGLVAAGFAAAPDADMVYAPVGLLDATGGPVAAAESFWAASTAVHRSVTHSLVVAVPAAVAFALWSDRSRRSHAAGVAVAGALVATAFVVTDPLAAIVMAAFLTAGALVARLADTYGGLGPRTVFGAALVGLWSHPWGDAFTGQPPHLLYPFADRVLVSRVALSADPTVHLLGAFAVELGVLWLAAAVYCRLTDRSIPEYVGRRAAVGGLYGAAALAIDPPTLSTSYHFVFSILAVGLLIGPPLRRPTLPRRLGRPAWTRSVDGVLGRILTGLSALTVALAAYAAAYAVVAM
ncbi:metal-dependent hydrolase [Halostella salina]|uniref:metal-dependent hydrolase n=1 Tax=Halostella salina TaxID=1547897 RepID=UPI000EF82362|nr:metal-dependent hydrolase [Halostella salina]